MCVNHKLLALFLITILFACFFFISKKMAMEEATYTEAHKIYPEEYYGAITISAKSAYIFDYTDQKPLFEFHADFPRPLASLAKLMSVPLALELLGDKETVSIPAGIDLESESDYSLKVGAKWNTLTLADFTLLSSSNAGAETLQDAADTFLKNSNSPMNFISLMNTRAFQLGMLHTSFLNVSGLDMNKTQVGAIGTARDMLTLVGSLLPKDYRLLSETSKPTETFYDLNGEPYMVANTNTALDTLSPISVSKTGYTDLAGGNLLILYQSHGKLIGICVLGSTLTDRFTDVIALKNATETYLNAL